MFLFFKFNVFFFSIRSILVKKKVTLNFQLVRNYTGKRYLTKQATKKMPSKGNITRHRFKGKLGKKKIS